MAAKRTLSVVERCYPHAWKTITIPSGGWVDSQRVVALVPRKTYRAG